MTRADLRDWLIAKGCKIEEPARQINNTANSMRVIGKHAGKTYIDLPFDEREVRCKTVERICNDVYCPIPDVIKKELEAYEKDRKLE